MFKVGDLVVGTGKYCGEDLSGMNGRVVYSSHEDVGVVFDVASKAFHNLDGRCEDGHGFWCHIKVVKYREVVNV